MNFTGNGTNPRRERFYWHKMTWRVSRGISSKFWGVTCSYVSSPLYSIPRPSVQPRSSQHTGCKIMFSFPQQKIKNAPVSFVKPLAQPFVVAQLALKWEWGFDCAESQLIKSTSRNWGKNRLLMTLGSLWPWDVLTLWKVTSETKGFRGITVLFLPSKHVLLLGHTAQFYAFKF